MRNDGAARTRHARLTSRSSLVTARGRFDEGRRTTSPMLLVTLAGCGRKGGRGEGEGMARMGGAERKGRKRTTVRSGRADGGPS